MRHTTNSPRMQARKVIGASHQSVGSPKPPYAGLPPENPPSTLDPQDSMGAGSFYTLSVARPDLLFPWARFPWMTIAGPQLAQAPSVHNIWNAVPPIKVVYTGNPQVAMHRSNRIRSVFSNRIKLPAVGNIFGTGGMN